MDISEITKWDAVRTRFREKPIEEIFFEFANVCSKQFMEEEPEQWYPFCDGNYTENDFHAEWLDMVIKNDKVAIECAREHLKTSFVLIYLLYRMFNDENFSALYFSAKQEQAKNKLAEFEEVYRRNSDWLDITPSDDRWSRHYKQFSNGANVHGEGWGTAVEGAHVQLIIMDDILQEEGTGTMSDEEIWNFYAKVVSPMVTDTGKIFLIGTKKRQGDIFDKIESNPEWVHGKYPSTPENPIFPEKWPKERLEAKKREMLPRNFNREFGLQVILEDDVLIRPDWNDKNRDGSLSYPKDGWREGMNVCGLDPAISPTGDHAAFFSMNLQDNGERFVLDVQRQQGMGLGDMLDKLTQLDIKYNYSTIMIEKNAFQSLVVNEAIDRSDLPIQGHETSKTKSDPSEGLPRIAVMFENGKYRYPYSTHEDMETTDMVIDALNSLKYHKGKVQNNHTPDIVMAKYMAEHALRRWEGSDWDVDEPIVRGVSGGI